MPSYYIYAPLVILLGMFVSYAVIPRPSSKDPHKHWFVFLGLILVSVAGFMSFMSDYPLLGAVICIFLLSGLIGSTIVILRVPIKTVGDSVSRRFIQGFFGVFLVYNIISGIVLTL